MTALIASKNDFGEPGKHTPVLYASKGRRGYKAFYSDVRDFLDNRMQSK